MPKRSPSSRSADDINKKFGSELRIIRERAGRSQTDVGRALGVSFQQIQKYENGTTSISLDRMNQLADFFAVSIGHMVEKLGRPRFAPAAAGFDEPPQRPYEVEPDADGPAGSLSKEAEALLTAFHRIRSRKLRRSVLAVVEACEGPSGLDG